MTGFFWKAGVAGSAGEKQVPFACAQGRLSTALALLASAK
jgi:hypothetical protein